jgi:hypothetical protein
MDELVFTNRRWPKVTPYQERWDTAGWALFTETWPPGVETLIIIKHGGMRAGIELSFPIDVQKEGLMGHGEREQMLKGSLRVFMGGFTDPDDGHE